MITWNELDQLYRASKIDLVKMVGEVVLAVNKGTDLNGLLKQKIFVDKYLEFSQLTSRDGAELEYLKNKYGSELLIKFLNRT